MRAVAALAVTALLSACGATPAVKMNDYEPFQIAQRVWHVGEQMLFVMAVPAFNQPVRIRSVEWRTVYSTGVFDTPRAYLLRFSGGRDFYHGYHLTEQDGLNLFEGASRRVVLDALVVHKLDNYLTLVVPVNIHQRGCHQGQLILHVTTSDGRKHTLATRWYVAIDTGVSKISGYNMCAGPRPQPSIPATKPA